MNKVTVAALSLVIVVLSVTPAVAQTRAGTDDDTSEVTFVHGIRGFFADVYLDDELILAGFAPERITDPLTLEAGSHRIDLREADADPRSEPAVTKTFDVPTGGRLTAVAHWTGVEDCIITLFDEAGDAVAAGSGKLIARHAAATGDVEFAVDDRTFDMPLSPNKELAAPVEPGEHSIVVNDRDSDGVIVESSQVPVPEGSARVVYLVGAAKEKSLGLLTQTVSGVGSNPAGVPTGNSGLAAPSETAPLLPLGVVAALGAGLLVRRRHARPTPRG